MRIFVLICLMTVGLAASVAADRITSPGEVILLSDEIFGNSNNVIRPGNGNYPTGGAGTGDGDDSDGSDSDSHGGSDSDSGSDSD